MSKTDGGEIPSRFTNAESRPFGNAAEPVGQSLSLQAQDGFRLSGPSKRSPGEPIQIASAAGPEEQQGTSGGAWDTKPPQAEAAERERRRLLEQQPHPGGAENICVDIQRDGNVDNAGLNRIAAYLQHKQSEFGANRLTLQSNVAEINAKFDQLAVPGNPHYQLTATMFGNRTHIELTDLSVRPRTPENLDPRAYQTQASRNRIAQERMADYRSRALRGALDFDTVAPRPLEGDRSVDMVVDRIAHFGQFSNPASGTSRRFEFVEAQRRFPKQESAPDVVRDMNDKLAAAGSEFRLVIEPPSNPRQASIHQTMQISIVNRDGRRYDTLQIAPDR